MTHILIVSHSLMQDDANQDALESERNTINNYANTTAQCETVQGKQGCGIT